MRFTVYQESRPGKRKNNQDRVAYSYSRDAALLVLADGMGGHLHGEVAAQLAVQFITQTFQREAQPTLPDPALFLSRTLNNAHYAIVDYAFDKNLSDAPRTTIVACVVQENCAHWAHAGDSRLYLLRNHRILSQTNDHSRIQLMLDQGLIDSEGARHHPARNRIYSCLGGSHAPQIDFSRKVALHSGDVLALCSDGIWGPVGDGALLAALKDGDVMQSVPRLMDQAEVAAGEHADNLSLLAMCWHDDTAPAEQRSAVSTQTMAIDDFTTQLDTLDKRQNTAENSEVFSDEEIARAIEEINSAINKFNP